MIPGLVRSPGGGHSNPLWYSCLENPMDREAWQAAVHGVTKSWTQVSDQIAQSCLTLCDPMDWLLPPWDSPGKSIGVGCHFLLQGILPTQGSNLGLLHCRQMLYCLNQGISELKWTGMGEFNADDHYISYCGQESLRRNGGAIIVNKNLKCSSLVQSQK